MAAPATFFLPSSSSNSSFESSGDSTSTFNRLKHDLAPLTKYFRQIVQETLARPIESVQRRSLHFIPPPIKEYKLDPVNIKLEHLQFDFGLETIHRKFKLDTVDHYASLEGQFGTKFFVIRYHRGPKPEEGNIQEEMGECMMAGCLVHNKCRNACFALWPALLRLVADDPHYISMKQVRVSIRPRMVLFPDYMLGQEKPVPPHDVFLIHDRHGEAFIYDPTIFQFGYKEWLYKEEDYKKTCMLAGSNLWSVDEDEEYDIHMEVEDKAGFLKRLIKWRKKLMRWPLERLKAGEVQLVDEEDDEDAESEETEETGESQETEGSENSENSDEINESEDSEDSKNTEDEQDDKSEEDGETTDEDGNDADDEAEAKGDSSTSSSSTSLDSSSFLTFIRFIYENKILADPESTAE